MAAVTQELCKLCNGIGAFEKNEKLYECRCALVGRLSATMPAFIKRAEILPEHLALKLIDLHNKLIYVHSTWADMRAMIKILMIKYPNKFIRITSDREIRDVFVGSKSASARISMDAEGPIYNNLQDLMDGPNLLIIRLGELSYKNKAAPGALEEAMMFRVYREMNPTWIVSDLNRPFGPGSHAYSDGLRDMLSEMFTSFNVPRISKKNFDFGLTPEPVQEALTSNISKEVTVQTTKMSPNKPIEKKNRFLSKSSEPESDLGLDVYGTGTVNSKTKFNKG